LDAGLQYQYYSCRGRRNSDRPNTKVNLTNDCQPGIKVTALTVDEFIDRYKKAHYDKARTMLIFTNPSGIVKVVESGVTISSVNAGGMRFSPGKNRISKAISVDEENIQNFRKLLEMNIEVECRMMPSEPKVKIESLLSKGVK